MYFFVYKPVWNILNKFDIAARICVIQFCNEADPLSPLQLEVLSPITAADKIRRCSRVAGVKGQRSDLIRLDGGGFSYLLYYLDL